MSMAEVFARDHDKFSAIIRASGAVVTEADGFEWIDPDKVAAPLLHAYNDLVAFGYANGLLS